MRTSATILTAAILLAGCATQTQTPRPTPDAVADSTPTTDPPLRVPQSTWTTVGHSVDSRDIRSMRFGDGPLRVLLIGSIHGDESEGLSIIDDLVEALDAPDVRALATVRVLRDVNPDGSARGLRTNANGVDLNRNWPASNFSPASTRGPAPLSEPETRAAHAAYLAFDPHLVVVFHSTHRGPFVNHDPPDAGGLAHTFARAAGATDSRWHVVGDMGYETPGSLGDVQRHRPAHSDTDHRVRPGSGSRPGFRIGHSRIPRGHPRALAGRTLSLPPTAQVLRQHERVAVGIVKRRQLDHAGDGHRVAVEPNAL